MAKNQTEEICRELVLPIAEKNNVELVDVEYIKENGNFYLRVYIDKDGGITIDDCVAVSEELSIKLDESDPIKESYSLEVSSSGVERHLKTEKDFERCKNEEVEIKLFEPFDGKKIFNGKLIGLNENIIAITVSDNKTMEFNKEKIVYVKKTLKF